MTAGNPFAGAVQQSQGGYPVPAVGGYAGGAVAPYAPPQPPANPYGNIVEVDFTSQVNTDTLPRFQKMKQGEIARIVFLLFNPNAQDPNGFPTPRFKMIQYFYIREMSLNFIAPADNEKLMQALAARFGEPSIKFGTIIGKYDTDPHGSVISNRVQLQAYIFGKDKWSSLKPIHTEWGLQARDLTLACTDVNWQKVQFSPAREALIDHPNAVGMRDDLVGRAVVLYDKFLNNQMGRAKSEAEMWALARGETIGPAQAGGFNNGAPPNPFGNRGPAPAPQFAGAAPAVGVGAPGAGAFADLAAASTQGGMVGAGSPAFGAGAPQPGFGAPQPGFGAAPAAGGFTPQAPVQTAAPQHQTPVQQAPVQAAAPLAPEAPHQPAPAQAAQPQPAQPQPAQPQPAQPQPAQPQPAQPQPAQPAAQPGNPFANAVGAPPAGSPFGGGAPAPTPFGGQPAPNPFPAHSAG